MKKVNLDDLVDWMRAYSADDCGALLDLDSQYDPIEELREILGATGDFMIVRNDR